MERVPERLSKSRKKKARTAVIRLRTPWLYGHRRPQPGDTALLDLTQLRRCRRLVKEAQEQGILSLEDASIELNELDKGMKTIRESDFQDVGAFFPRHGCINAIVQDGTQRHRKNKAAKQARKRQRSAKKKRRSGR